EQQEMIAIQLAPRLVQERNGGVFNWDALVSTSSTPLLVLRPVGALDPLRPLLMRPDILQDSVWRDGFDGGWSDTAKSLSYAFGQTLLRTVCINTDLVRPDEIKTARDLLDPKWKGRIVAGDPRTTAFSVPATSMRLAYGDDLVKRVYKDQEAGLNKDYRVMTEALIKGKYAVGIQAISEQLLLDMLAEGVGKNLRALDMPDCDALTAIGDVMFQLNRAPHPNATKVFLNWMLTKDGQTAWVKATGDNSRRLDVPPGAPNVVPKPGRKYRVADVEVSLPLEQQTIELMNKVLE
ncbi:MAG: extracellular solute-binding protein, partial [Chloroflexota bacterium]